MTPGSNDEIIKIPDITPELARRELARSILNLLERRWFDGFEINEHRIVKVPRSMLDQETRFLQVKEIAHTANIQQSLSPVNMQNVLSSLRDGSHAVAYAVQSHGQKVDLLLGVKRLVTGSSYFSTHDYINILNRSLRSNYPGVVLSTTAIPVDKTDILNRVVNSSQLACITGIPSFRDPGNPIDAITQSIDRLVDALRGEDYTLLILAEPIPETRLVQIIAQLRRIGEDVHRLVRESQSISRTTGTTTGKSVTEGMQASLGVGQLLSTIIGVNIGINRSETESTGTSDSRGASITRESLDKTAEFCEQALDHFITRVQVGRSLGFWNTGIFLATDDLQTSLRARGIARSLYSGANTYFEPIRVHDLQENQEVRKAIANMHIPELAELFRSEDHTLTEHPLGKEYQSLGTPITTDELSILISFPSREVPGLKMKKVTDFNLNPPPISGAEIGSLLYRGEKLDTRIAISQKALTRHTFVTGLTGSGKTNTCLALLEDSYRKHGLGFLVIDPAKTEYRFLLNSSVLGDKLTIFTLGDERLAPFRLNPFEFVRGFPILTHIDLLKAVFNAAFPMYASMPYLLEEALLEIYEERGWNISTNQNRFLGDYEHDPEIDYAPYLPRLSDLYHKIDSVVSRQHYDVHMTQDITAALKARIGSLLHGEKGLMLDSQRSIPIAKLLEAPVVLELRRAGDDDERAFIMALVFILLYEVCQSRPMGGTLQHVTLIEEAHRLLRNIPISVSMENANPRGKTVEMFTDMMAEMRAHGEGFIIVDQMPSKLVPDVIKGSNLKIIHRLMAEDDRRAVGNAMGMTEEQIDFLPRLKQGEAILHSEELEEPCAVMVDSVEDSLAGRQMTTNPVGSHTSRKKDAIRNEQTKIDDQEALIVDILKKRVEQFYQSNPTILHRHPACVLCDAPCKYHPEEIDISEHMVRLGHRALEVIALGSGSACREIEGQLRTEMLRILHSQFEDGYSSGEERCFRILLASKTARVFLETCSPGNWRAAIDLQVQLANTWEKWPNQIQDLEKLRELILRRIARAPLNMQAGCLLCPRRCWFGMIFQIQNEPTVSWLSSHLRTARPGQFVKPEVLTRAISERYRDRISTELLPFAGYCLLAQSTPDELQLEHYYHRIMPRKSR